MNPQDTIKLNVPLFIRLLEFAREDAQGDLDLHDIAGKSISLSETGKTLTMANYDMIVGGTQEELDEIRLWQVKAGIIK